MKIRDFIKIEEDIDVYDDVCEELAICFCGPVTLTAEGEAHFAEFLDYDVDVDQSGVYTTAIVHVDGDDGGSWKKRLRKAEEFFNAAAGYCSEADYDRWFCSKSDN